MTTTKELQYQELLSKIEQVARKSDPWEFIESGKFRIRTKDGKVVRFDLNTMKPPQREFYYWVKKEYLEGRRVMAVILKYRQGGFSTVCQAIIFAIARSRSNYNALTISDTEDRAKWLHNMGKFAQTYLERMGDRETTLKRSNRVEIAFSPNDSVNRIGSSKSPNVGISETRHAFHGSEVAYYDNWETIWGNVYPSLADLPGNVVLIESTANGVGDAFYNLCMRAKQSKSAFKYFFFPWFADPDNTKRPPDSWEPGEYVSALMKRYSLNRRQGYWYQYTLEEIYHGNKELMAEKYPSNDVEAFQVSGAIVFSSLRDLLQSKIALYPLGVRGECYFSGDGPDRQVGFREMENGTVEIIKEPELGKTYVMYSDVGEGIKTTDEYPIVEGEKLTTTFSTCVVRDTEHWEVCALMECQYPTDVFADEAEKLAYYYHKALWAVEIPGPGEAVTAIKAKEYPNMYLHQYRDPANALVIRKEWGYRVGMKQKHQLETGWQQFIRENPAKCHARIAGQALTYIQDKRTGRHRPKEGCFSDLLMADMGCIEILKSVPAKGAAIDGEEIKREYKAYRRRRLSRFIKGGRR